MMETDKSGWERNFEWMKPRGQHEKDEKDEWELFLGLN